MTGLNPELLDYLSKKLRLSKNSVRQYVSRKRIQYKESTLNAAAHLFAVEKGESARRFLDKEDKKSLPSYETEAPTRIKIKQLKNHKKGIINFFKYETPDPFIKGHIDEVNKAYTHGCYTCVFIFCRKIIENLIINILKNELKDRTLYWDSSKSRHLDFSLVLKNLYDNRSKFNPTKLKAIERLYQLAQPFKNDCNNKTHSLFHLVEKKKEIDDINVSQIINLIKVLEK